MDQGQAYAAESQFGPPSELISVDEFVSAVDLTLRSVLTPNENVDASIEEDASMEAPPAGSVTVSPQPTTVGVVIGDPHEAIPTSTSPDAGNSPVVSSSNYYDQAGILLPSSSSERYNIDAT